MFASKEWKCKIVKSLLCKVSHGVLRISQAESIKLLRCSYSFTSNQWAVVSSGLLVTNHALQATCDDYFANFIIGGSWDGLLDLEKFGKLTCVGVRPEDRTFLGEIRVPFQGITCLLLGTDSDLLNLVFSKTCNWLRVRRDYLDIIRGETGWWPHKVKDSPDGLWHNFLK